MTTSIPTRWKTLNELAVVNIEIHLAEFLKDKPEYSGYEMVREDFVSLLVVKGQPVNPTVLLFKRILENRWECFELPELADPGLKAFMELHKALLLLPLEILESDRGIPKELPSPTAGEPVPQTTAEDLSTMVFSVRNHPEPNERRLSKLLKESGYISATVYEAMPTHRMMAFVSDAAQRLMDANLGAKVPIFMNTLEVLVCLQDKKIPMVICSKVRGHTDLWRVDVRLTLVGMFMPENSAGFRFKNDIDGSDEE